MSLKSILHRVSGRSFKPLKPKTRWQDNPQFSSYIKEQISRDYETGVHGALRAAIGDKPLQHGVSVGSGTGDNERGLIAAGLGESFDLFEVSKDRIAHILFHLLDVLVGDDQVEMILTSLRENVRKRGVGKTLKLVDVEVKVRNLLHLHASQIGLTHSRQVYTRRKH